MTRSFHIFPTLACNGGCAFCAIVPGKGARVENDERYLAPAEWASGLEKRSLDALYITGGEPMLYDGLDVIVNAVSYPTWIYSNGTVPFGPFLDRVSRPRSLRVRLSFHPHLGFEKTLEAAASLRERNVGFSIHVVKTSALVRAWVPRFGDHGFVLHVDPDFRTMMRKNGARRVQCIIPNVIVGPDGCVYPCTSKMVRGVEARESILDGQPVGGDQWFSCEEPDACCACDVAFARITP